jgi:hypothetical protein
VAQGSSRRASEPELSCAALLGACWDDETLPACAIRREGASSWWARVQRRQLLRQLRERGCQLVELRAHLGDELGVVATPGPPAPVTRDLDEAPSVASSLGIVVSSVLSFAAGLLEALRVVYDFAGVDFAGAAGLRAVVLRVVVLVMMASPPGSARDPVSRGSGTIRPHRARSATPDR